MSRSERGFSLIELMVVCVVLGIVAAFAVPSALHMSQGMQLNGAANALAGQLRLARSKAMATGADQMIHFSADSMGCDYHVHSGGTVTPLAKLPRGVTYVSSGFKSVTLTSTGRASTSIYIGLRDRRGDVDTVSVQASGLVIVY